MSKQTPLQGSPSDPRNEEDYDTWEYGTEPIPGDDNWAAKAYDDLVETANEIGPDVTDMLWTAAKKEALRDRKNVSR